MFTAGPRPETLVGVVLAAGASTRMGRHKALLDLDGAPLVSRHVEALARVCDRIRVVVGAEAEAVIAAIPPMGAPVRNPWFGSTGPRESLLLAIRDLPDESWAIVTPVDVPPAPERIFARLLGAGQQAVPTFDGQEGHPVLIDVGAARGLLIAGHTLHEALETAVRVPMDWAEAVLNLNTPAEWSDWKARRLLTG